jgi:membrane-associated phospholipid phosphatase
VSQSYSRPKSNKAPGIRRRRRNWVSRRWHSVRGWIASARLRQVRTYLFQGYVVFALIAFAALALLANTTPVFQPDVNITRDLQSDMPSWFGLVMQVISWPGYGIQSVVIITAVVALLAYLGLRWEAITALLAGIVAGALNTLVKIVVHRPRPGADLVNVFQVLNSYSFPSGHVMFYTAFFGFLLFLSFILLKRTWLRLLINVVLTIFVALVGISRMYLGEHWASDVLGGYLLGSLVLIIAIIFYRWGKERYFVRQPVAAESTKKTPVPAEEKKEIKETLKNPLLMEKDQVKKEVKENVKDNVHDHHSDHPQA